jgi:hypothetical protein
MNIFFKKLFYDYEEISVKTYSANIISNDFICEIKGKVYIETYEDRSLYWNVCKNLKCGICRRNKINKEDLEELYDEIKFHFYYLRRLLRIDHNLTCLGWHSEKPNVTENFNIIKYTFWTNKFKRKHKKFKYEFHYRYTNDR